MDNKTLTAGSFNGYTGDIVYCVQLLQNFTEIFPVEQWKMKGFFVDSDLLAINCHWMKFEPLKPSVHFKLAVIYIIVFIAGLLSNSLVIYTIVWYKIFKFYQHET